MSITLRSSKGSALTHDEMDGNFSALTGSLNAGDGISGGGARSGSIEYSVNATVARTGSNTFTGPQNIQSSLTASSAAITTVSGSSLIYTSGSVLRLDVLGNGEVQGDLNVGGTVTAQEFHTEFISSSIIFSSGSTKFGDTLDDTHHFTGSVSITGSSTFTNHGPAYFLQGNVGIGTTSPQALFHVEGALSASGQITSADIIPVTDDTKFLGGTANRWRVLYATRIRTDILREADGTNVLGMTSTTRDLYGLDGNVRISFEDDVAVTNGNVGIGTATPSSLLDVNGNTKLGNANSDRLDILGQTIALSGSNSTIEHKASSGNLKIQTTGGSNNKLILSSSGDIEVEQSVAVKNLNTSIQSSGYQSGFAGQGFDINYGAESSAEFDNLTVRGSMRVFELIINQVRATNGSLFVSSTGKVDSVVDLGGGNFALLFDTGSGTIGHGFTQNDVIRAQQVNRDAIAGAGQTQSLDDNLVFRSDLTVTSVQDLKIVTASLQAGSTPPSSSFEYVRLGNTSNTFRQGNVYLTSDDNYAPFIDVVDGITSHSDWNNSATSGGVKVRVGKIDGINSPVFGDLSGYGMWASGSVYLEGAINATSGKIADLTITSDDIFTGVGTFNNSNTPYYVSSSGTFSLGDKLSWDGSTLSITGNISATSGDVTDRLSSLETTSGSIELSVASLNTASGSAESRLSAIEITTGSIELSVSALNTETGSLQSSISINEGSITSITAFTSSAESRFSSIEQTTGSIELSVASLNTTSGSTLSRLSSIELTTGSIELSVAALNTETGSLQSSITINEGSITSLTAFTSSAESRFSTIEQTTGSIELSVASLNTTSGSTNSRLSSIELTTGSIELSVAALNTETGSLQSSISINEGSITSLTAFTSSAESRFSSIEQTTGSIELSVSALNTESGSTNSRLSSIELTTGSIELSVAALNTETGSLQSSITINEGSITSITAFTSSAESRFSSIEQTTGSIELSVTALNTESGSTLSRLSSIELTTGSIELSVAALNTETGSLQSSISINEGSITSITAFTSSAESRFSSIEQTTGSIELSVSALNTESGSTNSRLSSIELTTGSIELRVSDTEVTSSNVAGLAINQQGIQITGSVLEFRGDSFFFGNPSQFISGSDGNLRFQSTNFSVAQNGDVSLTGNVSANSGDIGGFGISATAISSSDSKLILRSSGQITASNADLTGKITATAGAISDFTIEETTLQLITGSTIIEMGGLTNNDSGDAGFNISGSNTYLDISARKFFGSTFYPRIEMYDISNQAGMYAGLASSINSNFGVAADEFNFVVLANGNQKIFSVGAENKFAGFDFNTSQINSSNNNLILKANGQFTGSAALLNSLKITGSLNVTANTNTSGHLNFTTNSQGNGINFTGGSADLQIFRDGNNLSFNVDGSGQQELIIKDDEVEVGAPTLDINSTTITVANNIQMASGKGIDFSATGQASGMSSELLDDYEEGTWTPVYNAQDIDSIAMSVTNAHYTRVGNLVTVSARIATTSLTQFGGLDTALSIRGLPFTPVSNDFFAFTVGYAKTWSGDYPLSGYIQNSGTPEMKLTSRTSVNGATFELDSDDLSYGSGTRNELMFSAIYYT